MDFFWQVLQLMVALPLVLVVAVYVIKFGLTRLYPDHYGQRAGLKVIQRVPLNQKSWLCLVQAGERYLLIGVTSNGISSLGEIPPEEVEAMLPKEESRDFQSYLKDYQREKAEGKTGLFSLKQKLSRALRNIADTLD